MPRFPVIAFDGDDTLWHNERHFVHAQDAFKELMSAYLDPGSIDGRLAEAETRNLPHFGYGIKGFALSMIETAVELTGGRITGRDVQAIIDIARGMLNARVELLDRAKETVESLAGAHRLMLITKGDLRDQELKVARSGLAGHFSAVEIVSDKSRDSYAALLRRHAVPPAGFLMVGNSLRSDILPVLAIGGSAVYIPHHLTWSHEVADPPPAGHPGFHALEHIGMLPDLLRDLERVGIRERPGASS